MSRPALDTLRLVGVPAIAVTALVALSGHAHGQVFPACVTPPPGAGDCLTPTGGVPGCLDMTCCNAVCTLDSFCCDFEWDSSCVETATQNCSILLNDDCGSPLTLILNQSKLFDTTNATTDGDPSFICLLDGGFQIHQDIWYTFTPGVTGSYTVSLCGSSFDTILAVYQGCVVCPPTIDPIDCNNNACANQSELEFTGTSGTCYLIRVGGQSDGFVGTGTVLITTTVGPLPNDECDGAIAVGVPSVTNGSTFNATIDSGVPSPCAGTFIDAPGLWYRVTGTGNTITATTCSGTGTLYDTQLTVFCNTCIDLGCVAANDNTPGKVTPACDIFETGVNSASTVSWCSEAGTDYSILVHGFFGAAGEFELTVTDDATPCGPPPACNPGNGPTNDECADATAIGLGDTSLDTNNATTDGPTHTACEQGSGDPQIEADVWFRYTAEFEGELTVTTCGLVNFDTRIALYDAATCGAVGEATLLACNDNDPLMPCGVGGNLHSTVTVAVSQDQTIRIRVGGTGGAIGVGTLRLTANPMHPSCPGSGDCMTANGTVGCNDEACCNQVCAVLPECCDVSWDQFCADQADALCPPPPPCTILDALCQTADQQGHGIDGVLAAASDSNPNGFDAIAAESFVSTETGTVTNICFWGVYVQFVPPIGDCGPGAGDLFTITYYHNVVGSPDMPGAPVAAPFVGGATKAFTGAILSSPLGPVVEYQFSITHPPIPVVEGEKYWVEIRNATLGDCGWLWSTSPGDGLAHQRQPAVNPYSAATAVDFDLAMCVDLQAVECRGDLDGNGAVDIVDLLALLGAWGPNPGHPADLDGDGTVNITDLLTLLAAWGICP